MRGCVICLLRYAQVVATGPRIHNTICTTPARETSSQRERKRTRTWWEQDAEGGGAEEGDAEEDTEGSSSS